MKHLIVLALLLLAACGDDSTVADSSVDVREDSGSAEDSGGECTGCIADGVCESGARVEACGEGGVACVACERGARCVDGQCELPSTCESSCGGCCGPDGECADGDTDAACGSSGLACEVCDEGESCEDGRCMLPPRACDETCDGCCADGVCMDGTDAAACGIDGTICVSCGEASCSRGQCLDPACADSCDGCCNEDGACLPGTGDGGCGMGGNICDVCRSGEQCATSGCVFDPSERWAIGVRSAMVSPTDLEGDNWDILGGLPDVYVVIVGRDEDVLGINEDVADNTTNARFFNEVITDPLELDTLENLTARIFDEDIEYDDLMAVCELDISESDLIRGEFTVECPATEETTDATLSLIFVAASDR